VFHLDVAYVCNGFQMFFGVFLQVFQTFVSFVSFSMLQLLSLDVSKIVRGVAHRIPVESG
jgi:hypothetical protein